MNQNQTVHVIGAGLAGVEAAYQVAKNGINVKLYEMRPVKMTPAHHTGNFAELVCSNSLRGDNFNNAVGVLKNEMEKLDSVIIKFARENSVPAGGALAVDREAFSKAVTDFISNHPLIEVVHEEVTTLPEGPTIIASGPLTSDALSNEIKDLLGEEYFYFFDAAAPIIEKDSVNFDIAYYKSRYDKGENEYINCPMTEEEFNLFYDELMKAEVVKPKDFEEKFFEGCMPFEEMARRGKQTLLFGPMKPVGLSKPDGTRPYAVVQLRQDNVQASLYNIVGFQTHLTWPEQKRIIHLIPGLENATFVRYGVMHRNSFICSPKYLNQDYSLKNHEGLYIAGQITGVEGYVESAQSGMVAGMNMVRYLNKQEPIIFPRETVMGALSYYITHCEAEHFQPMKANFGILPDLETRVKKKLRKEAYANRAVEVMDEFINGLK
ncbi:methylenetetrahydrofolate--tRNA-(uracil(54)-C(5))-methyltransferase (FADH(2)-oxidizing) TrmFO [Coprobacillus sp. AF34-1BH]|uniref:methylenetetrahydrofolate--tRNA-(uracil(54)- C(5))-methyltransferase (FADH(2)-oxidizing) TrmFO n=1 Tax=Faecalibacillus faecis TaxID=1982628 RepID=UPI000664914A|nr:methylenetetrahydrofolate--tRNA-(uracil(54)-C(5))-methyltransferase (FADH(2)-oxidizing) TrmFO [Faecalibacillus faecis]KMV78410.1 tRNA:M(5)U-54 methyltransferase [Coprobacillus sp. 8_1_38FAA]RHB07077.1 methylenetetrahydrofolate--tRNA-(uracil(54)-C(5))-methyltransferase (FADH(2)-oxidizing) TrmFO [Coprobacillus sp. AM42-12AC]RHH14104.1 methylenetetrahydrofolate--tRNA-(uracil(54)-C(5))-methyltransferase (FADH(2)-oxidizing) TrmFO [Coprobacillus sp. AM18-4LB-d2]RHP28429.1 methylenetetrahydrofolate